MAADNFNGAKFNRRGERSHGENKPRMKTEEAKREIKTEEVKPRNTEHAEKGPVVPGRGEIRPGLQTAEYGYAEKTKA